MTNNGPSRDKTEVWEQIQCDQYPSKKYSIILLLRHGLESVDKSILKSRENPFQLSMHFLVMEFSTYLVVDKNGVNIQPNSVFTVLSLWTSRIFSKYVTGSGIRGNTNFVLAWFTRGYIPTKLRVFNLDNFHVIRPKFVDHFHVFPTHYVITRVSIHAWFLNHAWLPIHAR